MMGLSKNELLKKCFTELKTFSDEANSMVEKPAHYNHGGIECIDVIEDWDLGFNLGNCLKYICRAEHKGKEIEDLKKARVYLDRQIALREKEFNGTET